MSDHSHFSSYVATRSGERTRFVGLFQGCAGHWTAECWLARGLHQIKASTPPQWTSIFQFSLFLYDVWP